MMIPLYLLLPLAGAAIYALASVLIKRALAEGVTMDQSFHLTNLMLGLVFTPLFLFNDGAIGWSEVWKPALMGVTFFIGTWLTFVCLKRGDVSLVTPIMGIKVVLVAVAVVVLTGKVPSGPLWIAAILTTAGIFVMGISDFQRGKRIAFTVLVALGSSIMFAVCDVLVTAWADDFGGPAFLAIGSILVSVFSMVLWLIQGRESLRVKKEAFALTWIGAVLFGCQSICIALALSFFGDATGVNVVYASRGLWVIAIVVVFGGMLGNTEHREAGRSFLWRVLGTLMLTAAIVIAVVDRSQATSS